MNQVMVPSRLYVSPTHDVGLRYTKAVETTNLRGDPSISKNDMEYR